MNEARNLAHLATWTSAIYGAHLLISSTSREVRARLGGAKCQRDFGDTTLQIGWWDLARTTGDELRCDDYGLRR